jgi:hypothetical protein
MIGIDAAVKFYCRHDIRHVQPTFDCLGSSMTSKIRLRTQDQDEGTDRGNGNALRGWRCVDVLGILRLRLCFAFAKHSLRSG